MRLEGQDSAYVQVLADADEDVLVRHEDGIEYVGVPRRSVDGRVDLRCTRVDGRVDLRALDADSVYAWKLDAEKVDAGGMQVDRASFRDADTALHGHGMVAEQLDLTDFSGRADLSDAAIGTLRADETRRVETDAGTYIHDAPDTIQDTLDYDPVQETEYRALTALPAADADDAVKNFRTTFKHPFPYEGALGSLLQKGCIAETAGGYRRTRRGDNAVQAYPGDRSETAPL